MPTTATLEFGFEGCPVRVSGCHDGLIEITSGSELLASHHIRTNNPVSGLYIQPLDVLGRFQQDLFYFWADCSSGLDPRIELLAVKFAIASDSNKIMSSPVCSSFAIDEANILVNSSLFNIQVIFSHAIAAKKLLITMLCDKMMGTMHGSNSVTFFHFLSRTTSTIQVAALDTIELLAFAETMRKGDAHGLPPRLTSELAVPLPPESSLPEAFIGRRAKLQPLSSDVLSGTIVVNRVFPLQGKSGDAVPSSESLVLSCSYSVLVRYGVSNGLNKNEEFVLNSITKLVTLERQVLSVLKSNGKDILANPDSEISITEGATAYIQQDGAVSKTVFLTNGQGDMRSVGKEPAASSSGSKKIWKLCLDLGLISKDRRQSIDKLMLGQMNSETSKLSENLSKKTSQRIILLETLLCCGIVSVISEYILAVEVADLGFKKAISAPSSSSANVYSYLNEHDGSYRGADAGCSDGTAGVDASYVLRDVTRVHQWAELLLDQLVAAARDRALRRFVVPYLLDKDACFSNGGSTISDAPVIYSRELSALIRLCEGTVIIFQSLIRRKSAEVAAMTRLSLADLNKGRSQLSVEAGWTSTSLLDGQCVVAEALLGVLRVARLACSTRGVALPSARSRSEDLAGAARDANQLSSEPSLFEREHFRRSIANSEYIELATKCCDLVTWTKDIDVRLFEESQKLCSFQDLLIRHLCSFRSKLSLSADGCSGGDDALSVILGPNIDREVASKHLDRLVDFIFTPVTLAKLIQQVGIKKSAAGLKLSLPQNTSRDVALELYYTPIRHAFASVLYLLLDSLSGKQELGGPCEDEELLIGFVHRYSVACGTASTGIITLQVKKATAPTSAASHFGSLFPLSWADGVCAMWLVDVGKYIPSAVKLFKDHRLEFFSDCFTTYQKYNTEFCPFSPEVVLRYTVCRLMYFGNWGPARQVLRLETSGAGGGGLIGCSSFKIDCFVNRISADGVQSYSDSRNQFLILSLACTMLQLDDWQNAWHMTRKLCSGQNDRIRVNLIELCCHWLFLNGRASELIAFVFSEEDHIVLESRLLTYCSRSVAQARSRDREMLMDVEDAVNPTASAIDLAIEAVDIYILYLLSRHKVDEARSTASHPAIGSYISVDVAQLLSANVATSALIPKEHRGTSVWGPMDPVRESSERSWSRPDGVSSFEQAMAQW